MTILKNLGVKCVSYFALFSLHSTHSMHVHSICSICSRIIPHIGYSEFTYSPDTDLFKDTSERKVPRLRVTKIFWTLKSDGFYCKWRTKSNTRRQTPTALRWISASAPWQYRDHTGHMLTWDFLNCCNIPALRWAALKGSSDWKLFLLEKRGSTIHFSAMQLQRKVTSN